MIKDLMKWRFACKGFDLNRNFGEETMMDLLDTTRLSPSSFGLQAWKLVLIGRGDLRAQLLPLCWNQPQVTEAEYLVFFCADSNVLGEDGVLNKYITKYAADTGKTTEQLDGYKKMIEGFVQPGDAKVLPWLQRQLYLPAMSLMLAAAEKQIDSCPIEGFMPVEVAKLLDLPANLTPTVMVALGYRTKESGPKSRFNLEDILLKK